MLPCVIARLWDISLVNAKIPFAVYSNELLQIFEVTGKRHLSLHKSGSGTGQASRYSESKVRRSDHFVGEHKHSVIGSGSCCAVERPLVGEGYTVKCDIRGIPNSITVFQITKEVDLHSESLRTSCNGRYVFDNQAFAGWNRERLSVERSTGGRREHPKLKGFSFRLLNSLC